MLAVLNFHLQIFKPREYAPPPNHATLTSTLEMPLFWYERVTVPKLAPANGALGEPFRKKEWWPSGLDEEFWELAQMACDTENILV